MTRARARASEEQLRGRDGNCDEDAGECDGFCVLRGSSCLRGVCGLEEEAEGIK